MNNLVINPDETKSMIICSQQKRSRLVSDVMTLQIDSKIIESVNSFRILGLIIDKHLSWNDHVKYLSCSLIYVICYGRGSGSKVFTPCLKIIHVQIRHIINFYFLITYYSLKLLINS